MKRTALTVFILLFSVFPLFAGKIPEVSLRFARQADGVRIVLESDGNLIRGASYAVSDFGIRITFPSEFAVSKPDNFMYELAKEGHSLVIKLRDVADIKALTLRDPDRLVFDLTAGPAAIGRGVPEVSPSGTAGSAGGPERKTLTDIFRGTMQKTPESAPARLVVIDSGHGGYDYGIVTQEAREKDVDLALAKALNAALSKQGMTVFLTRRADQSASIAERINLANSKRPDLFVSIHASSSTDRFAVYVSTVADLNVDPVTKKYSMFSAQNAYFEKSRKIARAVGESLKREFGNTVVIRELPLPILYSMNAPAILIEYPSLDLFGRAQSMQSKFASSVADGIMKYEDQ